MRNIFQALLLLILFACKTTQVSQTKQTTQYHEPDTISLVEPAPYWITSEGDTLYSLDQEIQLNAQRLLKDTIRIKAVGDIMMGTSFPSLNYLPPDNGNQVWEGVKANLKDADITFGNLEGVILDTEGDPKKCRNPKNCFLFKTPSKYVHHFREAGFDLFSLANNHANDFGEEGRQWTQHVLDSIGIVHAGAKERPYSFYRSKGLKIGFAAFSPNKGTISMHDQDQMIEIVKHLDSLSDIVIISFHAGAEGSENQNINRETEFYFGENRGNVYQLSHTCIDNGADVIFGHGPHVVRAVEVYKERFIAYSLGNFLTYGRFNLKGPNAYAPIVEIELNSSGKFIGGRIFSYFQSYTLGPRSDENLRAGKTIKKLSQEDFPENPIIVDEDGRIIYIQN